jgi:hypothetical protein
MPALYGTTSWHRPISLGSLPVTAEWGALWKALSLDDWTPARKQTPTALIWYKEELIWSNCYHKRASATDLLDKLGWHPVPHIFTTQIITSITLLYVGFFWWISIFFMVHGSESFLPRCRFIPYRCQERKNWWITPHIEDAINPGTVNGREVSAFCCRLDVTSHPSMLYTTVLHHEISLLIQVKVIIVCDGYLAWGLDEVYHWV